MNNQRNLRLRSPMSITVILRGWSSIFLLWPSPNMSNMDLFSLDIDNSLNMPLEQITQVSEFLEKEIWETNTCNRSYLSLKLSKIVLCGSRQFNNMSCIHNPLLKVIRQINFWDREPMGVYFWQHPLMRLDCFLRSKVQI